jgi:hypothetical protein
MAVMEAPESIDMMLCLREIAEVLQVPSANVAKVWYCVQHARIQNSK